MRNQHTVYLALGTNLGDRKDNLERAVELLPPEVNVCAISRLYETAPAYVLDQPSFLNIVIQGQSALSPDDLLSYIKNLEVNLGRTKTVRFGPRQIDIDIIFYDDLTIELPHLQIPHPRIAERPFVLLPLLDIAPDMVHPVLHKTVADLAADLPDEDSILDIAEWRPERRTELIGAPC